MKFPTNYLLTNYICISILNVCKQMIDVKLNCYSYVTILDAI